MKNPLYISVSADHYFEQLNILRYLIPPVSLNKRGKHSVYQILNMIFKEKRILYILFFIIVQNIYFICLFTPSIFADETKIKAFASILPHAYFVERIGGEYVSVRVLVGKGESPELFNPSPKKVIELQDAQVFFHTGMPFEEAWKDRISSFNSALQWVDLRNEVELLDMEETSVNVTGIDVHEHDHNHHHENKDPHIWLDPVRAIQQVNTIANALIHLDEKHKVEYSQNCEQLILELNNLHSDIEKIISPTTNKVFALFHPSWGYFADRYGLKQIAIETGGKEPSAKQLGKVIEYIKQHNIKTIFVQEQMDTRLAKTIAEQIGGGVVVTDPLAKDYINNLRETAIVFAKALQ